MTIINWVRPGIWLDWPDGQEKFQMVNLFSMMEGQLNTAMMALNLFEEEAKRGDIRIQDTTLPFSYWLSIPLIYAHAYIYSLDMFIKLLDKLSEFAQVPTVVAARDEFLKIVPDLKEVRHSIQHLEERVHGKVHNKEISLKPIDTAGIKSTGGTIVVTHMRGEAFHTLLSDGSLGKVEVNEQTMRAAYTCMEKVMNSFNWIGEAETEPRNPPMKRPNF